MPQQVNPIMKRRLRYQVAMSLDGFIAGPNGEYDWIVMDPAIDFATLFKEFDTAVMGRKTYEVLAAQDGHGALPGLEVGRLLTDPSSGHPPGRAHRERRSLSGRGGAQGDGRSRHLALRRR